MGKMRGWNSGDEARHGKGRYSEDYKTQKITVKREFVTALANMAHMNVLQIAEVAESQALPALQVLMGKIVLDAIEGDSHARTIILDRLFGKVADAVDVSHSLELDSDLIHIPVEKLVAILELQSQSPQGNPTHDTTKVHDERAADSAQCDDRLQSEGRGSQVSLGLHHPATGPEGARGGDTDRQLSLDEQDNHRRVRGYKTSSMEVRDSLLEVGFIAEKYKGNPS